MRKLERNLMLCANYHLYSWICFDYLSLVNYVRTKWSWIHNLNLHHILIGGDAIWVGAYWHLLFVQMFHALKPNIEFYGRVIIIFGLIMIFVKQSSAAVFCPDLYELLYLSIWLISARDIYAAKHNWVLSFVFFLEMSKEKK